jgi:hypothetical protein
MRAEAAGGTLWADIRRWKAMKLSSLAAAARPLGLASAFALFFVLFLDWRDVSVVTPGVFVDAGSSAWSGWGAVAGILAVAFVVSDLRGHAVGAPVTGLAVAGFTIVEFFTGSVETDVAGVVSVDTSSRLWPAYVGLGLALVLGAACAVRLLAWTRRVATGPAHLGQA